MAYRGQNRRPGMVQAYDGGRWIAADAGIGVNPPPVALYVNQTTGDDDNDGTAGNPLATITEALRRVGDVVKTSCEVLVTGAGTYAGEALSVSRDCGPYFLDIIGDPSTETVIFSGTVQSATYQEVTSVATWATNEVAGLTLRVLSGVQAGQERKVLENSSDTVLLVEGFSSDLAAGVSFEIVRPGVVLSFSGYSALIGTPSANVGLWNVELDWPDGSGILIYEQIYVTGITAAAGTNRHILGYTGFFWCEYLNGFGWAGGFGDCYVYAPNAGVVLSGNLGRVFVNGGSGVGHTGGVRITGKMCLDTTSSDIVLGIVGFGGNSAEVILDDLGGSRGSFWTLGGRMEVLGPLRLVGSGAFPGRWALRDKAFVELGHAVSSGYVDIALGSELRIASGNSGGFSSVVVDGTNCLPLVPFTAPGEYYFGNRGSFAGRD